MKVRALKAKYYCFLLSSAKCFKGFSKINDSFNYFLQKWIISHPHLIQFPFANDYITVKFNGLIRVVMIELSQKVLLQISVSELHTDMLKKIVLSLPFHEMIKDFSVLVILLFH